MNKKDQYKHFHACIGYVSKYSTVEFFERINGPPDINFLDKMFSEIQ